MEVAIKKIDPHAILPVYGTIHSAGFDIFSAETISISPRSRQKVRSGIAISWTFPNVYLQILSRSGLFWKHGISVEGGVIDWDYRREIEILLMNHSDEMYIISQGDRIAQGVFYELPMICSWKSCTHWLDPGESFLPFVTTERQGGLGSTGV